MRLGLSLAVALLGTLHLTSSVPSSILKPSAFAVQHDLPAKVPNASAVERKNASSSGSQKCGMSKVIVNETTVITIQKTVETKTIPGEKCCCPDDLTLQCKGCPDRGAKEEAPVTTPQATTEPRTSTTPQTPTAPTKGPTTTTPDPQAWKRTQTPTGPITTEPPTLSTTKAPTVSSTRLTTTTTEPPTSPTTQAPIVPTTRPTAATRTRPTSPTTQAPTVPSTRPTTATTEPSTSSTTEVPTVSTTRRTTITPEPPTSPTTQASTAPTTRPTTTTTEPPTSPTTQAPAVPTTRPPTTTPVPSTSPTTQVPTVPTTRPTTTTGELETSATSKRAKGPEFRPRPSDMLCICVPANIATEPPTSPTTQVPTVPTTAPTTPTSQPETSATTQTAKGHELQPQHSGAHCICDPTTTEPPTSPTTQAPTVPTTRPTATTTEPPTSPTTQAQTVTTTRPTTTTPEPPTSPTTQASTIPTTSPTTTTTELPTSPTTQAPKVTTTRPTTTTIEPSTSPTTQAPIVPSTSFTTTTPKPEVSATTQRAEGTELRPQPSGSPNKTCSIDNCKPPKCTCMSEKPPGGLSGGDMPQFVMLTFDDAVTKQNMQFYQELLGGLKRKNKATGCGIAATFFVSAEYLDYPSVNELYRGGNEIALHSISHNTDTSGSYWNGLDTESWEREVVDERTMVAKYANVSEEDIRGLRGPFFFTGGDAGFRMQHRHLDYDCTLIHKRDNPDDAPVFPYTLDYGFQKPCMVKDCPSGTYPGLWTVPLNYLFRKYKVGEDDKYGHCAMADACTPTLESSDDTFQYLRDNFENFYTSNRAPFPVFIHEAWLKNEERKKGYLRFVDWLLEKEDVYLVTVSEVLDFMRDPKPRSSYAQRRCTKDLPESTCPKTRNCRYSSTTRGGERYMNVCGTTCPTNYPWINNPDGN